MRLYAFPVATLDYHPRPNGHDCRICRHSVGDPKRPGKVTCKHPKYPYVPVFPECGCCSWEREPGSDDDVKPPTA
jgi:hypothetical protein